jgi:uncharacterized membrane protein
LVSSVNQRVANPRHDDDLGQAFDGHPSAFWGDRGRRPMTISRHLWHRVFAALALLAGVLLIAMSHGAPAMAAGIALVYLSVIALVVAVFRRIGQSERRWRPARSFQEERALVREVERSLRQAMSMRGKDGPGLSRG